MGHRVTEVELPPLFCPLEYAVHPHVRRIEQRAEEWIHASGMCATEREKAWVIATHSGSTRVPHKPERHPHFAGRQDHRCGSAGISVHCSHYLLYSLERKTCRYDCGETVVSRAK